MSDKMPMNGNNGVTGQVHRFHDAVSVALARGPAGGRTESAMAYLTPKEARALARAIYKAARSCERETFTESTCGTAEFTFGKAVF